jgi:hypothetical protein
MTIQIIGKYQSMIDAANVANGLELKGFKARNILILTNQHPKELEAHTDVNIASSLQQIEDENETTPTFFDKLKKRMAKHNNHTLDMHDRLIEFGVSEEQAVRYIADVESGKTVVIADDELKMGHV